MLTLFLFIYTYISNSTSNIISIGNYKGLEISKNKITISENEINEELDKKINEKAVMNEIKNRPIKKGDIIYISYNIYDGLEIVKNLCAKDVEIEVGANQFNQTIEKNLIGMHFNENKKIKINANQFNFKYSFKNNLVIFDIKVNKITELVRPNITNSFIKKAFGYNNINEYKQYLKKYIYSLKKDQLIDDIKEDLLRKIIKNSHFNSTIYRLYKKYYASLYNSYKDYSKFYNNNIELVFKEFNTSEKELKKTAIAMVKEELVIKRIAEKEKLIPSPKELYRMKNKYIQEYGYDKVEDFEEDCGREYLDNEILKIIVLDYIYSKAVYK